MALGLPEAAAPITDRQEGRVGVDMDLHLERPTRPRIGVAPNVGRELGDNNRRPIDTRALPLQELNEPRAATHARLLPAHQSVSAIAARPLHPPFHRLTRNVARDWPAVRLGRPATTGRSYPCPLHSGHSEPSFVRPLPPHIVHVSFGIATVPSSSCAMRGACPLPCSPKPTPVIAKVDRLFGHVEASQLGDWLTHHRARQSQPHVSHRWLVWCRGQ